MLTVAERRAARRAAAEAAEAYARTVWYSMRLTHYGRVHSLAFFGEDAETQARANAATWRGKCKEAWVSRSQFERTE